MPSSPEKQYTSSKKCFDNKQIMCVYKDIYIIYIYICLQTSYKCNYLKLNANTNMHYTHTAIRSIRCIYIYTFEHISGELCDTIFSPEALFDQMQPETQCCSEAPVYHLSWSMFHAVCCWKKCIYNIE